MFEHDRPLKTTPIQATPVLKGQDLINLVNELKRTDNGKERRQKAWKAI